MVNEKRAPIERLKRGAVIAASVVVYLLTALAIWFFATPTLNINFASGYLVVVVSLFLACVFFVTVHGDGGWQFISGIVIALLIVVILMVVGIKNSTMFKADDYRNAMGEVVLAGANIPQLNIDDSGLVPLEAAKKAAQIALSQDAGLGSQVEIGEMTRQIYQGKLVYVAFLEHTSMTRWLFNSTTPGYVIVSAHDASKVQLVKNYKLRVLQSGYLRDDVERVAQMAEPFGYWTDFTAEIDDDGNPYWVASEIKRDMMLGPDKLGDVLVIDAQSGAAKRYSKEQMPAWIDRVMPKQLALQLATNWGKYVHGFLNYMKNGIDVIVPNDIDLVFDADGRTDWFVPMRSTSSSSGINGYLMIDTKTGRARYFHQTGSDEQTAAHAMESVMPEKQLHAGNILPFSIGSDPVYISMMYRGFAFGGYGISLMRDYNITVVANTLSGAIAAFNAKLAGTEGGVGKQSIGDKTSGMVERISMEIAQGNSQWRFMLKGDPHVYLMGRDVSEKAALVSKGDEIKVDFVGQDVRSVTGIETKF